MVFVSQALQGGPHNHTISGLAVALKMATAPEFMDYQQQIVKNAKALADQLIGHGYSLVSGGTDNHLMLVDLKPSGVDGSRVQIILDLVSITLNKNSVPGDKSAMNPGGIRIGTPALTTRGFDEDDFRRVGDLIHRGIEIAQACKAATPAPGKLADFKAYMASEGEAREDIKALREEVEGFAGGFPMPGLDSGY